MLSFHAASIMASCVRTEYPAQLGGQDIAKRSRKMRGTDCENKVDPPCRHRVLRNLRSVGSWLRAIDSFFDRLRASYRAMPLLTRTFTSTRRFSARPGLSLVRRL